jgi:hypothetical protein
MLPALLLLAALPALPAAPARWTHPGVLLGARQLAFVRAQVAAGAAPFAAAYAKALASPLAALTYAPQGPPASGVIDCGSYSHPDDGCSAEDSDGAAAYLHLVLFALTDDSRHAAAGVRILTHYAAALKGYSNSNAPLQAAWGLSKWSRAAELAAHLPNVTGFDARAFTATLARAALPLVVGGSPSNGNWELAMIEGALGYAVLAEDAAVFDSAVRMWQQRVPAYFYCAAEDGGAPRPAPRGHPSWYGQAVFSPATSGVAQETCRDEGHTTFGIASASNAAETALLQGQDLWAPEKQRLAGALELNAALLLPGAASPPDLCSGRAVDVASGRAMPSYEVAYNRLHNGMGVSLPHVEAHLANLRAQSNTIDAHMCVCETLTHGGLPPSGWQAERAAE